MLKIFKLLYRRKLFIITVAVLYGVVFTAYNAVSNYNKATMVLSLNYQGAEKGLNPDGTRFNIFEIKSKEVVNNALGYANIPGMTVDVLSERIDVFERTSGNASDKVRSALLSGNEEFRYLPNEFSISYSQKSKFTRNYTYDALSSLAKAYKEFFEQRHTEKGTVLNFDDSLFKDYGDYEYVEIADLLSDKVEAMERYISAHNDENGTFRSNETGQTFSNVLSMLQNFRHIEVEKYRGFVVSSALAKNSAAYVRKLAYDNQNLSFEKEKSINEESFIKGAIDQYDPNITGVAFIPSIDKNNEFYMNRTKTGLDYLTNSAYAAGINTERIGKQIDSNNYLMSVFGNTRLSDAEYARIKNIADTMLENLKTRLMEIQGVALKTDNEYMIYKTRDYLKFSIPKKTIAGSINLVSLAKNIIIAFFMVCALILFKEYFLWKRGGERS